MMGNGGIVVEIKLDNDDGGFVEISLAKAYDQKENLGF